MTLNLVFFFCRAGSDPRYPESYYDGNEQKCCFQASSSQGSVPTGPFAPVVSHKKVDDDPFCQHGNGGPIRSVPTGLKGTQGAVVTLTLDESRLARATGGQKTIAELKAILNAQREANDAAGKGSRTDVELEVEANEAAGLGAICDAEAANERERNTAVPEGWVAEDPERNPKFINGSFTHFQIKTQAATNEAAGLGAVCDAEAAYQRTVNAERGLGDITDVEVTQQKEANRKKHHCDKTDFQIQTAWRPLGSDALLKCPQDTMAAVATFAKVAFESATAKQAEMHSAFLEHAAAVMAYTAALAEHEAKQSGITAEYNAAKAASDWGKAKELQATMDQPAPEWPGSAPKNGDPMDSDAQAQEHQAMINAVNPDDRNGSAPPYQGGVIYPIWLVLGKLVEFHTEHAAEAGKADKIDLAIASQESADAAKSLHVWLGSMIAGLPLWAKEDDAAAIAAIKAAEEVEAARAAAAAPAERMMCQPMCAVAYSDDFIPCVLPPPSAAVLAFESLTVQQKEFVGALNVYVESIAPAVANTADPNAQSPEAALAEAAAAAAAKAAEDTAAAAAAAAAKASADAAAAATAAKARGDAAATKAAEDAAAAAAAAEEAAAAKARGDTAAAKAAEDATAAAKAAAAAAAADCMHFDVVFRALDVDSKDSNGFSDPYLTLSVAGTRIHKTEVIKKTLSPTWKSFAITVADFDGGNMDCEITATVIDWDRLSGDDVIGVATLTLKELCGGGGGGKWPILNAKKMAGGSKAKEGYQNSGNLELVSSTGLKAFTAL